MWEDKHTSLLPTLLLAPDKKRPLLVGQERVFQPQQASNQGPLTAQPSALIARLWSPPCRWPHDKQIRKCRSGGHRGERAKICLNNNFQSTNAGNVQLWFWNITCLSLFYFSRHEGPNKKQNNIKKTPKNKTKIEQNKSFLSDHSANDGEVAGVHEHTNAGHLINSLPTTSTHRARSMTGLVRLSHNVTIRTVSKG